MNNAIACCAECDGECFITNDEGDTAVCPQCRGDGSVRCFYCERPLTVAEAARVDNPTIHSNGPICDACVRIDVAAIAERASMIWRWRGLPGALEVQP
jgi:hypothetical protein